ncbi:MAG: sugar ABC transporter substrate-binding protein [Lachnospiraceae bacterium]|nr:sugar ABC transporter substrate-binding protein [Lachnospiraceae bacterium]MCI1328060.1 sugar ABC transporter substrate-binding protein [Lachnospiraceae bacterium]
MKKRIVAIALTAAVAVSLAGCGGSSSGSSSSANTGSASAGSTGTSTASVASTSGSAAGGKTIKLSMIVKTNDEHFMRVKAGADGYCEEHPNVSVDYMAPTSQTSYDEQNNAIETALSTDGYDGYVFAPIQADSCATLCQNATKPIVAVDTDFQSDKKLSFIGTGNENATKEGAKVAVEKVKKSGVDKPTAAVITGTQGDPTHDARLKGYKEGVEEAGGEVVDVQYTDMSPDQAALAMEGLMQKYPDGIDIVFSTADVFAMAASKVISDADSEAFNKTLQCGFDGTNASTNAIKAGTMQMDIAQNGYDMGYKAVEAVVNAINGQKIEEFIDSGYTIVDPDSVDDYIQKLKNMGSYQES